MLLSLWKLLGTCDTASEFAAVNRRSAHEHLIKFLELWPTPKLPPRLKNHAGGIIIARIDLLSSNSAIYLYLLIWG